MALASPVPFLWPGGRLSLPVGGLGVTAAQSIIFTLQQCMVEEQDEQVAKMWLQTLQLCQVFHERLLSDLEQVDVNLSFWNKRLQEGSHVQFMLLQRGPITFARYMRRALRRTAAWVKHLLQQRRARQQQQQQQSGEGGQEAVAQAAAATTAGAASAEGTPQGLAVGAGAAFRFGLGRSKDASKGPTTATNKMQRRVLLLEALRSILAETLAQVTQAARLLWLNAPAQPQLLAEYRLPTTFQPTWASSGLAASGDTSNSWEGNQALLTATQDTCLQAVQQLQQLLSRMREQLQQLNHSKQTRAVLQEAAVTRLLTGCASISRHHPINTTRSFALRQTSMDLRPTLPSGTYDPHTSLPTPGRRPSQEDRRRSHETLTGDGSGNATTDSTVMPPPGMRIRHPTDAAHTGAAGSQAATPRTDATDDLSGQVGDPQKQLQRLLRQLESELQVSILPKVKKPTAPAAPGSLTSPRGVLCGAVCETDMLRATMMRGTRTLWQLLEGLEEDTQAEEETVGEESAAARRSVFAQHASSATAAAGVTGTSPAAGTRERVVVRRHAHQLRAADALAVASHAARKAGPLVQIPEWALMPSWWQQRWVTCGIAALFAAWGARWLWSGGTDKLVHWSTSAWTTTQASVQAHIINPLCVVHDELTKTFRNRPSIVSPKEFAADKESLMRMLKDFERDVGSSVTTQVAAAAVAAGSNTASNSSGTTSGVGGAGNDSSSTAAVVAAGSQGVDSADARGMHTVMTDDEQDALIRGMNLVMNRYESELRDPLRNLLMGQLARSLLIQVQRLKLDTEAAMLELDQILRANELSISLVAAIPALAISWGVLSTVARWLMPRAPDVKRAAVPCRMALAALERALQQLADQEVTAASSAAEAGPEALHADAGAWGAEGPRATWADAEGMTIYHINKVYNEAVQLFKSHDRGSRFSEWPSLSTDLAELGTVPGAAARLRVIDRMLRTYKVFQR